MGAERPEKQVALRNEEMSTTQRLLRAIVPSSWFQQMEAESREWIMTCSQCGAQRSVWDAGGVRWKAKGEPTRRVRCTSCGQITAHKVSRRQSH